MTNFEKFTETPETLGELLASLTVIDSPWEDAFHKAFCADCERENCDEKSCPHKAERNNPLWWLMQEAEVEQDTPPEELPEPLREIKQKYPTVKIYKTSPVSHGLKGNLHYMEVGAAMMFELGKVLWAGERKYRVTIECDPETGKFEAKREDEPLERRPMWRGGRLDMEPDHGTSREGWKEWPSELSAPRRFCCFSANRKCRKMAGKSVQPLHHYTCRFRPSSLKQADKSGLDGLQSGK